MQRTLKWAVVPVLLIAGGGAIVGVSSGRAAADTGPAIGSCLAYSPTSALFDACEQNFATFKAKQALPATSGLQTAGQDDTDPVESQAVPDMGPAAVVSAVKTDAITDLTAFDTAQVMPADMPTRIQSATTGLAATTARIQSILATAVAPSTLSGLTSELSNDYAITALDQASPSLLNARFTVVQWEGVQVVGSNATAIVVASEGYQFSDSPGQWLDDAPEQYTLHLQNVDGVFLMVDHTDTPQRATS